MFTKSRKEKFVDQAQDLAHDLTEAIAPRIERARDEIAPHLEKAREELGPRFENVRDQVAPKLADARDEIAPRLAEARDNLAPHVEDARDRIVKGAAAATAAATPVAVEARRRGINAAAALKGEEPVKRKGRKRKLFVFATLAGLGCLRGAEAPWRGVRQLADVVLTQHGSRRPAGTAEPVRTAGRQPRCRRPGRLGRRGRDRRRNPR